MFNAHFLSALERELHKPMREPLRVKMCASCGGAIFTLVAEVEVLNET